MVSDNEIESGEEKGPPGLSRVKSLVIAKVFKGISMICDNFKLMLGSLQTLQECLHSSRANLIAKSSRVTGYASPGTAFWKEGTWMELWRVTLPLGEYSSYPSSRSIYFNGEWKIRVGMDQYRRCEEGFFEKMEGLCGWQVPGQRLGPIFE